MPDPGGYPPDYPEERDYSASEPSGFSPASARFTGRGGSTRVPRRVAGRKLSASPEDRVLRLLLTEPESWDRLSAEEHHLLTQKPAPHGPLFAWLEAQLHEHGPQPWAALREGLRGHPSESHAVVQISEIPEGIECDWNEVRGILDKFIEVESKRELNELIELGADALKDPVSRQRLQTLAARLSAKKTA
jgi:DNA primase